MSTKPNRRTFLSTLSGLSAAAASVAASGIVGVRAFADKISEKFSTSPYEPELLEDPEYKPLSKSELRRKLSSMQYKVTQLEGTEPAFQNKYWNNKQKGVYECVVCKSPLFHSQTKYKSGTGWPSFWAPIREDSVGTKTDWKLFYSRTEVHCKCCGAHLGHVFNDGPAPTGKRYCMNSASLWFVKDEEFKKQAEERLAARKAAKGEPAEGTSRS